MRANVNPDARVLELGGGYASPELHAAFPNAITVEHDERWTRYLRSKGLRVIHAPLEQGWYQAGPELTAALQTADVVLIDGPPGLLRINGHRHTHHIPPGTVVIHDDTQRHYIREAITDPVIATITDRERTTTVTRKSPARA
jgi:predicted O-methyltransferase YrrM